MLTWDLFDLLAPIYDRLIRPPADDTLTELVELPQNGRLLDAAGGTGRTANRYRGWNGMTIVLDRSLPMLARAATKQVGAAVAGDIQWLPFRSGSFQRVVMVDALHHLSDPSVGIAEMWRCLKPGGRLVIEEPNIERLAVKLIGLLEKLAGMGSRFRSAKWINRALRDQGATPSVVRRNNSIWYVADKPAGR